MRVVAMWGVIVIHTKPFEQFESATAHVVSILVNHGARFAVPFVFIIAGYLWMEKLKRSDSLRAMSTEYAKRILWVFLFWSFIYAVEGAPIRSVLSQGVPGLLTLLPGDPLDVWGKLGAFVLHGSRGHLWFLPALLSAVLLTTFFVGMNLNRWLLPVAIGLYAFGVLGGSYATTPVGISVHFQTHLGPFVSTLFFVLGVEASRYDIRPSLRMGAVLLVVGLAAHSLEALWLWEVFHVAPTADDHLWGTTLFGLGAAAIALAKPARGDGTLFARWGPYMLGVYVVHVLFVDIIGRFRVHHVLWEVFFRIAVFGAALGCVLLASRSKLLKPLVA